MEFLNGNNADEVWRRAALRILEAHPGQVQASRGGETLELLHVGLQIADPRQKWVASRLPAMNPAFALVEAFWICAGRQDSKLPSFWNRSLPRYCGEANTFHGAYGHRLRAHFGLDQLDRAYRVLSSSPESRQCVLQIWDSTVDMPAADGSPAAPDIPCNVLSMPKIRGGRLEWMQVMRSNDLFRGLPHNLVQFTIVQEVLSGWLGVNPGSYSQLSDSLHIYVHDLPSVTNSTDQVDLPSNSETLALDRKSWDSVSVEMLRCLDILSSFDLSEPAFRVMIQAAELPTPYLNCLLVAAADSARRRGWDEESTFAITRCTNSALVFMWDRWAERARSKATKDREAFAVTQD